MSTLPAAVLAHQGGWDEVLLVLAPLAVFAWLLLLANRRASSIADGLDDGDGSDSDDSDSDADADD